MSDLKRKASPPPANGGSLVKRVRASSPPSNQIAISSGADKQKALMRSVPRTSGLESPIVSLAGAHTSEVLSCRFDPTGQYIAACSADRSVCEDADYGMIASLYSRSCS